MGDGDDEKEQIKGEIESKEGDPQSLKFIRRSELSWSAAAKPTVSSWKYVHCTTASLYKVSSAASKTLQFCNFHMCKTTFIMLCRVIMCNKHRLKRQHLHIQFWGPIRCWKKCPLGVTNMRCGCIVLHSASRPHLIRCHRAGSDFEVASYKAPTPAKHCTCQPCSAMQLAL